MEKFLPLLLCLSLSIFTVAHATKPGHTPAPDTKTAPKEPMGQQAKTSLNDANTDDEVASGDDGSMEDASDDKGEDMNDDDSGDAASDENTADDDEADADGGGDEGE